MLCGHRKKEDRVKDWLFFAANHKFNFISKSLAKNFITEVVLKSIIK